MPSLEMLLPIVLILSTIGAFTGVLAGLLGVGGGIILVPAFFYMFSTLGFGGDQLMQICLATSLATIVVTSILSVIGHHRKGAVDMAILRGWAIGIVIGTAVGVLVVSSLRSAALQFSFGALALGIGFYMLVSRPHWRLGDAMPTGLKRTVLSPAVGILSVLMGIGGGSFGVPLMTLHNVPIHRAVGTAAGFGILIAAPSVLGFLSLPIDQATRPPLTVGAVNLPAFVIVVVMTILTTPIGVRLAHALDARWLKRAFGAFLILVALNMLRKAVIG